MSLLLLWPLSWLLGATLLVSTSPVPESASVSVQRSTDVVLRLRGTMEPFLKGWSDGAFRVM